MKKKSDTISMLPFNVISVFLIVMMAMKLRNGGGSFYYYWLLVLLDDLSAVHRLSMEQRNNRSVLLVALYDEDDRNFCIARQRKRGAGVLVFGYR